MTTEEWRWAVDYEGDYEVSNLGRVRSWKRQDAPPRLLSTNGRAAGGGYRAVCLSKGDTQRSAYVHRLVLDAFVGPLPDGQVSRHLDGNVDNNTLANLRYGTQVENVQDQFTHGTYWTLRRTHCRNGHVLEIAQGGAAQPCESCREGRKERDRMYRRAKRRAEAA